jgi:hypothetical protein
MSGMGHNHEAPYTVEQATLLTLLQNKGFWPPSFGTRNEKLAWLEQNRWRVDPDAKRPAASTDTK